MTQPPPPPPPPPGASPPPPPPPAAERATGWAGMRSLRDEPSPYSVLLAVVVVLIMAAPNLAFLAIDRAIDLPDDAGAVRSEAELIFGLVFALVIQIIVFVVALVPLLIRRRLDRRLFGPSQPTGTWKGLGFGLLSGIAALFSVVIVNMILALSGAMDDPVEQQVLQDALSGGAALALAGIIAVVVAPIVEEVIFRGILHRALADRFGVWVGAIVSSALFALIHVEVLLSQPFGLVGLFVVGFVLALAYHWTGNLLVPILGHAVFNAAMLSLAVAIERLGLQEFVALALPLVAPLVAGTGGLV